MLNWLLQMMLDVATEHWGIMVERVEMWVEKHCHTKKCFCLLSVRCFKLYIAVNPAAIFLGNKKIL